MFVLSGCGASMGPSIPEEQTSVEKVFETNLSKQDGYEFSKLWYGSLASNPKYIFDSEEKASFSFKRGIYIDRGVTKFYREYIASFRHKDNKTQITIKLNGGVDKLAMEKFINGEAAFIFKNYKEKLNMTKEKDF